MKPTDHQQIGPADQDWTPTATHGVEHKLLAERIGTRPHDVQMWRIAPGAGLPTLAARVTLEAIVLEGSCELPEGRLESGGYTHRPPGTLDGISFPDGATLFARTGFSDHDGMIHLPAAQRVWHPGQGNLRVQPLHAAGDSGTALVHWPAGERFVPHRHWGGEEILVLSGTFRDEHGIYPAGTWLLSPHLSAHHPFVQEETAIFVKTGHLTIDEAAR